MSQPAFSQTQQIIRVRENARHDATSAGDNCGRSGDSPTPHQKRTSKLIIYKKNTLCKLDCDGRIPRPSGSLVHQGKLSFNAAEIT